MERAEHLLLPGQGVVEAKRHGPQSWGTSAGESNLEASGCQRKEGRTHERPGRRAGAPGRLEAIRLELEREAQLEAASEIALRVDLQRPAAIGGCGLVRVDSQVVFIQDVLDVEPELRV